MLIKKREKEIKTYSDDGRLTDAFGPDKRDGQPIGASGAISSGHVRPLNTEK